MIYKVLVDDEGNVRVIDVFWVKRGIGKESRECLISCFNKNKNPKMWERLLKQIDEEKNEDS